MELRHLRYFVAVAEEMNFHRAAKRLNISQPPLSLAIKQLEDNLETKLFARVGRGIEITPAGEFLLERSHKIFTNIEKIRTETKRIGQGQAGTIKIGFISSAITGVLQNIVSAHRNKFPLVSIEMEQLVADRIADKILKKELDIGVVRTPMYLPQGLKIKQISKESWYAAVHKKHPYSGKKNLSFNDLQDQPVIFFPRWNGPASYDQVMELFKKKKVSPHIVQEAPEQMTIAGLVASNIGIGIVPECMKQIKIKDVVHLPLKGAEAKTGFALIYRKQQHLLVDRFLQLSQGI